MEQARIKALTQRAKESLKRIHEKHDKPMKERMLYKLFIKEKWVTPEKDELLVIVKNKVVQRGLNAGDFMRELSIDFMKDGVNEKEYEVSIK